MKAKHAAAVAALVVVLWLAWPRSAAVVAAALARDEDRLVRRAVRPQLCIVFVSCNRTGLLEKTVDSVAAHLARYEPGLAVELLLVDQGSRAAARSRLAKRHTFGACVYAAEARGYGWPFNEGFFGLCRAPFVAVIEDDFPLVDAGQLRRPEVFGEAIELLGKVERAVGVVLKSDHWLMEHKLCEERFAAVNVSYGSRLMLCVAKVVFGSYTNSAAVYDRKRLARMGRQHEGPHGVADHETPEGRYSLASKALGMGLLFVERYKQAQDKPFVGVAVHAGEGLSTGRQDTPCRKGEKYVVYE